MGEACYGGAMGPRLSGWVGLLLAASCGYESYYPQPIGRAGVRLDSGAGGSLNCSSDADVAGAPRVALSVTNTAGSPVDLRYIGPDCQPVVVYAFTFPGEVYTREAFEGAWFDVRDESGSVLSVWQVPDGVGGAHAQVVP